MTVNDPTQLIEEGAAAIRLSGPGPREKWGLRPMLAEPRIDSLPSCPTNRRRLGWPSKTARSST